MELVSGLVITIPHPEAVMLRGDIVFFVGPENRNRLFDSTSVCQLYDPTPPAPTAAPA
jgi:hypothetical protein